MENLKNTFGAIFGKLFVKTVQLGGKKNIYFSWKDYGIAQTKDHRCMTAQPSLSYKPIERQRKHQTSRTGVFLFVRPLFRHKMHSYSAPPLYLEEFFCHRITQKMAYNCLPTGESLSTCFPQELLSTKFAQPFATSPSVTLDDNVSSLILSSIYNIFIYDITFILLL